MAFGLGFPPLMLIPTGLFPPPAVVDSSGEPPGTPDFLPSGDMEMRAARLPAGG